MSTIAFRLALDGPDDRDGQVDHESVGHLAGAVAAVTDQVGPVEIAQDRRFGQLPVDPSIPVPLVPDRVRVMIGPVSMVISTSLGLPSGTSPALVSP